MLKYKTYIKLIRKFLDDGKAIDRVFADSNKTEPNRMYSMFFYWAEDKTKIKYKPKDVFWEEVLSRPEYSVHTYWGKDFIVNTRIPSTGTGERFGSGIVF